MEEVEENEESENQILNYSPNQNKDKVMPIPSLVNKTSNLKIHSHSNALQELDINNIPISCFWKMVLMSLILTLLVNLQSRILSDYLTLTETPRRSGRIK